MAGGKGGGTSRSKAGIARAPGLHTNAVVWPPHRAGHAHPPPFLLPRRPLRAAAPSPQPPITRQYRRPATSRRFNRATREPWRPVARPAAHLGCRRRRRGCMCLQACRHVGPQGTRDVSRACHAGTGRQHCLPGCKPPHRPVRLAFKVPPRTLTPSARLGACDAPARSGAAWRTTPHGAGLMPATCWHRCLQPAAWVNGGFGRASPLDQVQWSYTRPAAGRDSQPSLRQQPTCLPAQLPKLRHGYSIRLLVEAMAAAIAKGSVNGAVWLRL